MRNILSRIAICLYACNLARLRAAIRDVVKKLEGGEIYSVTLREIFRRYHDVAIGLYTHGGCFVPGQVDSYTTIGRYCSVARTVHIFNRNHPVNTISSHAFFFNPALGYAKFDMAPYTPLVIGNDVWIGHAAIITPNVKYIGDGAVVAAGAVVNKDVPPYAIVVGNPGRVVRYRFSKEKIKSLLDSNWWNEDIETLQTEIDRFQQSIDTEH